MLSGYMSMSQFRREYSRLFGLRANSTPSRPEGQSGLSAHRRGSVGKVEYSDPQSDPQSRVRAPPSPARHRFRKSILLSTPVSLSVGSFWNEKIKDITAACSNDQRIEDGKVAQ
jgi:hypothetical protein